MEFADKKVKDQIGSFTTSGVFEADTTNSTSPSEEQKSALQQELSREERIALQQHKRYVVFLEYEHRTFSIQFPP